MTEFSPASLKTCEDALQRTVVMLGLLEEITEVLEQYGDLKAWLKKKVEAAVIDRKPYVKLKLRSRVEG